MAKRIVAAWIEQVIEFDSFEDRKKWYESLKPGTFDIMNDFQYPGIVARVRKQYNNNRLWKFEDDVN